MYRLLKRLPDASSPFFSRRGIIYTRVDNSLVRMGHDFYWNIAPAKWPFVLEGNNGEDVILKTAREIVVLDGENNYALGYSLRHSTEVSLVHRNNLILTTTYEQDGRIVVGRYNIPKAKFIWKRDVTARQTFYSFGKALIAMNEAKDQLVRYNVLDGSISFSKDIYDLKAVIDKRTKHKISEIACTYNCLCLYLTSRDDQVLVGLDPDTGAERWRVREGLYRSHTQADIETFLSLELYDVIEIDANGRIIHSVDLRKTKPDSVISFDVVKFRNRRLHMAAEVYGKPGISVWDIDSGKYLGHHALYDYRDEEEPPLYIDPEKRSLQFYNDRMYVLDSENTLYIFEEEDSLR